MLISVTSMVIISQQHFLYNPAIFIPINATSIPAPTRHPPQISILISQYIILKMTGLDIPLLICATFFPVSIIHPAMFCMKVTIVSMNISRNINASYMTVFVLYLPASFSLCVSYLSFAFR